MTASRGLLEHNGDATPPMQGPLPKNFKYGNLEEELLHENQLKFFSSANFQSVLQQARSMYENKFPDSICQVDDVREHASDPHPKRALREQCLKELEETGDIHLDLWLKSILYKMKPFEYAKPGKYGRGIGDLGVAASLQGFMVTEYLKQAQAAFPIYYKGGVIMFVKSPDEEKMIEVFSSLITPSFKFVYVYHSDDACYSVITPQGIKRYNMDISSCDSSHGPAVFQALISVTPSVSQKQMSRLVAQCCLPLRVVSIANPQHVVLMKAEDPVLCSGATITTAINNLANISIAVAIADNPNLHPVDAARLAGYNITLQECVKPQDLQFLKCSPTLTTTGRWMPVLNPGVFLRASGACKGDLPGRGPWEKRAALFQGSLLQGYMSKMSNPWLEHQRKRFPVNGNKLAHEAFEYKLVNEKSFTVTNRELFARYDLDDVEYEDVMAFLDCGTGDQIGNAGLAKILNKDYGVTCNIG